MSEFWKGLAACIPGITGVPAPTRMATIGDDMHGGGEPVMQQDGLSD
ncbi:hypothetical protein [Sphingobium sp. CCH11-B1]|nr:hypothetical protein [Sphingobium sp. CCH11-B1]MEA3388312.1 hypothetical protein [Pseudomonadota bacterium]